MDTEKRPGLFSRIKQGLTKTRDSLKSGVDQVFAAFHRVDEALFEELEEALILADMGVETTLEILDGLREQVKARRITEPQEVRALLAEEIARMMTTDVPPFEVTFPAVFLIIGVNGVGKTTTVGKLSKWYTSEGKSVLVAAADTFRAAAIDQLAVWCDRAGVPMIRQGENSDPAAVIFDAASAAKARGTDLLLCDTAGRLHNKKNLMDELRKIHRIVNTQHESAHKEVLLILDATTGQNAIQQAKLFQEAADITGIILTKLDGTTKGGMVVAIKKELDIPVRFITVGEGIDDLQPFDAEMFARALFEG
ncbi:MAG: signal recognition particle-docking protein FtsY [Defluviitaleaceae bacterium]|nr:signal recognition particle-docking protein FtsY [Defluviitaleaceae bacterium]MCL2239899.1 signal recognition particle-docking protein FtsY [Defluviitaleaceae bacterium]